MTKLQIVYPQIKRKDYTSPEEEINSEYNEINSEYEVSTHNKSIFASIVRVMAILSVVVVIWAVLIFWVITVLAFLVGMMG